jgi:hypothetical protein
MFQTSVLNILDCCLSMAVIRQCKTYISITTLVYVPSHHLGLLKQRHNECDTPSTCQTIGLLRNKHVWCNAHTIYLMSTAYKLCKLRNLKSILMIYGVLEEAPISKLEREISCSECCFCSFRQSSSMFRDNAFC